ncbi:MAG: NAD(P)-dependent oxidoreductase [Actinomycetota bacterium]
MAAVLVTGSAGQVGGAVASRLEAAGRSVTRFDLTGGRDLRDADAVLAATTGCDAVVHAGAIPHDTAGTPEEIVATNVLGTWHVLTAAEQAGVERVVYLSSGQVFGCAEGEGVPDYLPIDDEHPRRAARPYGMSKCLAEDMCRRWSARTGVPTVVFRPVLILNDRTLVTVDRGGIELDAFVHVDDVAAAIELGLTMAVPNHVRAILCGPGRFDTSVAERTLGWRATRSWPTGPA